MTVFGNCTSLCCCVTFLFSLVIHVGADELINHYLGFVPSFSLSLSLSLCVCVTTTTRTTPEDTQKKVANKAYKERSLKQLTTNKKLARGIRRCAPVSKALSTSSA